MTKIRKALNVATKEYDRECKTHRAGVRERVRRLEQMSRVFRELLRARRANGKELLIIGEGSEKEFLYTAEIVHKAFSGHFNKHLEPGGRNGTGGPRCIHYSKKDRKERGYREKVLGGTADPTGLQKIPPRIAWSSPNKDGGRDFFSLIDHLLRGATTP